MVSWKLLPRDAHGTVRIYVNPYQDHSSRHYHTLKIKRPSQSIWVDTHGNRMENVLTPTSGHHCEQFTHTTSRQPWLLPSQINNRIMASCMETHFVHIGSGIFCNWVFMA